MESVWSESGSACNLRESMFNLIGHVSVSSGDYSIWFKVIYSIRLIMQLLFLARNEFNSWHSYLGMKYIKFTTQASLMAVLDMPVYKQPWDFHLSGS